MSEQDGPSAPPATNTHLTTSEPVVPRVYQGQGEGSERLSPFFAVSASFQHAQDAEAALYQGLAPEHIAAALESSTQLQLRAMELEEKRLSRRDARDLRGHERSLKRMELRGRRERGIRWISAMGLVIAGIFVVVAVYHGKYEIAQAAVFSIITGVAGYMAGRAEGKALKNGNPE